jgi:hypothetical protein
MLDALPDRQRRDGTDCSAEFVGGRCLHDRRALLLRLDLLPAGRVVLQRFMQ